ncbi:MAG: DUF2267 domain-containing protein [Pelatocladus maniniholoensis HA4357-MV3]|jgi:uncharacterized protein (DUF2267 family)|uniref:DUF2267 domain-containing protein n=1 Tax=Pelatocladus maniniholoensis HA4357-MV3 TaxID=1117104 RepID=A0A9E3H6L8_9NOST|nr:DUF2267 domain-containing protein [Pelatocladus maniniholoensis HA4357-MV3]BAZ68332.1 hypothetical protein NIES4106_30930 [Fischerella sp. NIES-4106]
MKYDEFITHVQSVAQLDTREETERATRATLETIKERIVGDEAKDLASQLPKELAECLHGREGQNGGSFSLQDFISRVSKKEGVEPTVAVMHIRSVFTVLLDAVTPGEFADFQSNFSDDYAELFPTASTSEIPG